MSTIGEGLFAGARPEFGVGIQQAPAQLVQAQDVVYGSFGYGLALAQSEEDVPQDSATLALDMEVNRAGRLYRSPGLSLVTDEVTHSLVYTFVQASLDYASELVTIDPPYLGVSTGGAYTWVNLGLAATISGIRWCATNYGGIELVSNGSTATYARQPGAVVVTDISAQIIARTMASAFGRVFAGYITSGGVPQSLGIKWNAASAVYNDWTGLGSGGELLLTDASEADKIVKLISVGLGTVGILCRKTLWVGNPTGDYLRPMDPVIRVGGLGCIGAATADLGPTGVVFLSDEGVCEFNLTDAKIISTDINSDLLPLDYTRISSYVGKYQPQLQRYILCTPFCTWIYEYPNASRRGRWFKRSLIADGVLSFSDQLGGVRWDQVVGSWDSQTKTWDGLTQSQQDSPPNPYFIQATKLARESRANFDNLGTSLTPLWRTPQNSKVKVTDQYTTLGFEVEYASLASSSIKLSPNDHTGAIGAGLTRTLPSTSGTVQRAIIPGESTGLGAQVKIEVLSGDPSIIRIRQFVTPAGPTIISL